MGNFNAKSLAGYIRCGHTINSTTHGKIAVAHGEETSCVWTIASGNISMDTSKRTDALPMVVPEVGSMG